MPPSDAENRPSISFLSMPQSAIAFMAASAASMMFDMPGTLPMFVVSDAPTMATL